MDFLRKNLLSMAGIQEAKMQTNETPHQQHHYNVNHRHLESHSNDSTDPKKKQRYTGIPAVPKDIGFNSGSKTTGGSHSTGFFSQAGSNPAVIIGLGLTTMALLGMIKKSVAGDKLGTQKYMRYRIIAQFFTVTALVAGVTIFAGSTGSSGAPEQDKPAVMVANSAN